MSPQDYTTVFVDVVAALALTSALLGTLQSATVLTYEEQDARYISPPAAGLGAPQPCSHIDTGLINRLAAEVAPADVVSAWEEVEALRRQLRRKDEELHSALVRMGRAGLCLLSVTN